MVGWLYEEHGLRRSTSPVNLVSCLSSPVFLEEDNDNDELSTHRRKNKAAEKELHCMSEKLSRRLQDLDQVGLGVWVGVGVGVGHSLSKRELDPADAAACAGGERRLND